MFRLLLLCCGVAVLGPLTAHAADSLNWRSDQNLVDANLTDDSLPQVLRKIAQATGWKIYYEPGSKGEISVKFANAPEDDALRRLLGKFNFAKETTNGVTHLLVFQTVSRAATQAVSVDKPKDYLIHNELLVKLKKNSPVSIEDLAKQLHARIIRRDDRIGLYRLQFDDEAAANAALQSLSGDDAVAAVGHNYIVDPPTPVDSGPALGGAGPASPASLLNPKAPDHNGLVIGLVDTAIQPQDGYSQYMLSPISVVGQGNTPSDQPAHATAMLETMVQSMGNDPSMIQPVNIYQNGEQTTTIELMEGILAAVNSGDQIVNLSLGGTGDSPMLQSLIDSAMQKGIVFVAASGNSGGTAPTYPASYPGVVSVGALSADGQLASYADRIPTLDSSAPGASFIPFGNQVWEVQGTSPATATASAWIANTYNENQGRLTLPQVVNQWIQLHPPPPAR
jgi:hypothetical protein